MTVILVEVMSELGVAEEEEEGDEEEEGEEEEEEDRREVELKFNGRGLTQPQTRKLVPFTSDKQVVQNSSALVMPHPMSTSLTFLETTSCR